MIRFQINRPQDKWQTLSIVLVVLSLIFGTYVGIFECLIDGIVNVIRWQNGNTDIPLFWNVCKMLMFPMFGTLCALPGLVLAACVSYLSGLR